MDGERPENVKEGIEPERFECFCARRDCMYEAVKKVLKQCEQQAPIVCTICGKGKSKTSMMRLPCSFLHACRVWFSRRDSLNPSAAPLGGTLEAGSPLCQACYMKGHTFSTSEDYAAERMRHQ
ncbi:unnamed protein product [Pylaiella littoralis]